MTFVQFLIIGIAILALLRATLNFRKGKIPQTAFIFWLGLWLVIIVIAILPQITDLLSDLLGIGRGVDVAVYFSIILIFFLLYRIIIRLERIDHEITKIVRHLSFKEKEK